MIPEELGTLLIKFIGPSLKILMLSQEDEILTEVCSNHDKDGKDDKDDKDDEDGKDDEDDVPDPPRPSKRQKI